MASALSRVFGSDSISHYGFLALARNLFAMCKNQDIWNGSNGWIRGQTASRSAALAVSRRSDLSLLDWIDTLQIPVEFAFKFFHLVFVEELPQIFVRLLRIRI
jgi:hypothetical protein